VPGPAGETDITWLRVLLVTDLLARAAELHNLQVLTVLALADQASAQVAAFERTADALGIHPPAARASLSEARTSAGGPIDVHVVSQGTGADGSQSGLVARVGAARLRRVDDHTEDVLVSTGETVALWRRHVAAWAEAPSRPIPARITEQVRAAFGDLDTASALALLRDLVLDADVPAGAKFETFVYADRVLGLDLPRDIGRASG